MKALSAFIVGYPAPIRLSTTNADGVFVVATKVFWNGTPVPTNDTHLRTLQASEAV
ncbi:MAG TPA: hypothetical protein VFS12_02200 [Terriglobia bacterium]|nr:hypothetical protein [Terriglobia bacterium]